MPSALDMILLAVVIIAMSWVISRGRRRLPDGKRRTPVVPFLVALVVFLYVMVPVDAGYIPLPFRNRHEFVCMAVAVTAAGFVLLAYMYFLLVAPLMDRVWLAAENSARRMVGKRDHDRGKSE